MARAISSCTEFGANFGVASKSKDTSEAKAIAKQAEALAVAAEEKVTTARATMCCSGR